jgi:hypothetical protein
MDIAGLQQKITKLIAASTPTKINRVDDETMMEIDH